MVRVVAQNAERRGIQGEMEAFAYRQSNPARGEDAPKLTMREERDFSVQLLKMG